MFLSLFHLRSLVCFLRHTGACLFSRRFRRRRDAVFPDAAVKELVPRLHIVGVYTRSSGRVTDVTKLNRLAGIIIATDKRNLYILLNEMNYRSFRGTRNDDKFVFPTKLGMEKCTRNYLYPRGMI